MSESDFDDFDIGPQADEAADFTHDSYYYEEDSNIETMEFGDLYVEEDLADEDEVYDENDVYDDFADEVERGDWDGEWDGDDWDEDE